MTHSRKLTIAIFFAASLLLAGAARIGAMAS